MCGTSCTPSYCRWVCTSGMSADLETTDSLAQSVLEKIIAKGGVCVCGVYSTFQSSLIRLLYLMHVHTHTHTHTHAHTHIHTHTLPVPDMVRQQYEDNLKWIREAGSHQLVRMVKLSHPDPRPYPLVCIVQSLCEMVSAFFKFSAHLYVHNICIDSVATLQR